MEGKPRWRLGLQSMEPDLGPPKRERRDTDTRRWALRPNSQQGKVVAPHCLWRRQQGLGPWTQHQCLTFCELRVMSRDIKQGLSRRTEAPALCTLSSEVRPPAFREQAWPGSANLCSPPWPPGPRAVERGTRTENRLAGARTSAQLCSCSVRVKPAVASGDEG